jgi:3-oxoacyl-[acyl-carrier protein] reductase
MSKLAGKVALVTGAGRGIGRATALKLASEGASLVVNDLDEGPVGETVAAIVRAGGTAIPCTGSVIEAGFGERFVQTALDRFGGLDIIVNNAGYQWDSRIEDATDEQLDAMYEVHVKAQFRILRAAIGPIKALRARELAEGRNVTRKVVNVTSISGTDGSPTQIAYAIAKSAIVGLTRTVSKDWGPYGVCVNCVAFGVIITRLTTTKVPGETVIDVDGRRITVGVDDGVIDGLSNFIPLGRVGTPEDAAGGIYLFCIPESDYVSGQLLVVAGGLRT